MNPRRHFLAALTLATAGVVAAPRVLLAKGQKNPIAKPLASIKGLIFSLSEPGMWAGKAKTHAPKITVSGREVRLRTLHGMAPEHYIVRHTLLDKDGNLLGAKTFSPSDKAESVFTLPKGYKGTLVASSYCNLHDLWVSKAAV